MYRTVSLSYWTDPKIRSLSTEGKLLMLYLITNPHSHFSGLYYLPWESLPRETGVPEKKLLQLSHTLSIGYLAKFDRANELVWVRNMLKYQGRGARVSAGVNKHLAGLHESSLLSEFVDFYKQLGYTLSIPYRYPTEIKDQEQDQDQIAVSVPAPAAPRRLEFDWTGFNRFWEVWPKRVDKDGAVTAWKKLRPDEATVDKIIAAVTACSQTDTWLKDGGQFIPYPGKFLNRKRWEDEGVVPEEKDWSHLENPNL